MVKPINTENSLRLLLATSCNNPHIHFPVSNESWLRPTTVNMTAVIIAWENHIRQNIIESRVTVKKKYPFKVTHISNLYTDCSAIRQWGEIDRLKELLLKTDARLSEDGKTFRRWEVNQVLIIVCRKSPKLDKRNCSAEGHIKNCFCLLSCFFLIHSWNT